MKRFLLGLKYIFIPVLCIFLMSHNAGALVLTDNVNLIRGNMTYNFASPANISNCSFSNYNQYLGNPNADLVCYVRSVTLEVPSESYVVGDYLTIPVYLFNSQNNNSSDATFQSIAITTSGWDLVDVNFAQLTSSVGVANLTLKNYTAGSYSLFTLTSTSGNAFSNLQYGEYLASGKATHWRPQANTDYSNAINSVVNAINNSPDYTNKLNDIKNSIDNITSEEETATQEAADDSATTGDQSSADAASATTGLISAIGGFVSAITNASPSNCNINANLNHINLGVLDLCSMPVPSYISIIGSIIAIMLVIPFCIVMFNRFIGLFRSFQG